ncbi:hypothetical protein Rs2_51933 [Raphanus sativus]|nr:hypothetical protein Rs2_51933 [Raphanus sativus]
MFNYINKPNIARKYVTSAHSIVSTLGVPAVNQLGMNPGFPTSVFPTPAIPSFVTEPIGQPSACLLLKDMFMELDFDEDIKEDVGLECTKYGRVNHIYVDKKSACFVYLRFASVQGGSGSSKSDAHEMVCTKDDICNFFPYDFYVY